MLKNELNLEEAVTKEPRVDIVNEQYKIEIKILISGKRAAVFLVPSCVTPLYIPIENLEKIKEIIAALESSPANSEKLIADLTPLIPDGLVRKDILKDPAQLNTVIERVGSINKLLQAGAPITILCVDRNRKKVDSKTEIVDDTNVKALEKKYKENLDIVTITQELYNHYKDKACAASYCFIDMQTCEKILVGVNATQVNTKEGTPNPWNIIDGEAVVTDLDKLLQGLGLPPLEDMVEKKIITASDSTVKLATTRGLFTAPAANEPTQEEQPMPSSSTYQP